MAIADIEAMSDQEVAELMGASEQEVASEPWTWREAAKAATDEFADRIMDAVQSGRTKVITEPSEIRRRLGGRPRVGGEAGEGPSTQVRVRVTTRTRTSLEKIAATQGRSLSDISREALDKFVAQSNGSTFSYWQNVPNDLAERLDALASLLDRGRDVRHSFGLLGDLAPTSRAEQELRATEAELGDRDPALRVHRLVQLWGVISADLMAGLAALCRERVVLFSLFPLVRGVVEHSVRIVWLLDPDGSVDPRRRCARALLEELLSADEACRAASRLAGRNSPAHRQVRAELDDLRSRVAPQIANEFVVSGALKNWRVAGETLLSPTDGIARFGAKWGDERQWVGTYDALSAYSHPTLLGLDFYAEHGGEPVLSTDQETVDKVIAMALVPYYQALRHHLAFNGWKSDAFDAWEDEIKTVYPRMIVG